MSAQGLRGDFKLVDLAAEDFLGSPTSALGTLIKWGATVPTDGTAGYAPGCLFLKTSGNGIGTTLYVNEGSSTSSDFNAK